MRRKKPLPKPEPPPEGWMLWHSEVIPISQFEREMRQFYNDTRGFLPDWRDDPTYHMKINKRRKQNAV